MQIENLQQIAEPFKAILCDVWGVIHNGLQAHEQAIAALQACRAAKKIVILITNAPRPQASVAEQLKTFDIDEKTYDGIITSGDITKNLIEKNKQSIFHLGPTRDKKLFSGIDINFENEKNAKCVVCTGLFDDDIETPENYKPMFENMIKRNCKMICANPDLIVERGEKIIYCAGALAQLYEKMGGKIEIAGKPYKPIYEKACKEIEKKYNKIEKQQVLAIGDAIATDGLGAKNFNLPFLFITQGIHGQQWQNKKNEKEFFKQVDFTPQFWQTKLKW